MRHPVSCLLLIAAFICSAFIFIHHKTSKLKERGESEDKRDGMQAYLEQQVEMMRDPVTGTVPMERMLEAKRYKDELIARHRAALVGVQWTTLGPKNQAGRSRAMLIDANDGSGNTVFASSVGGGLWKTTDITQAAPLWTPVNDFFDNLAVTSIAQDPSNTNILYLCTGEGYSNFDAIQGLGVWKSTDGGANWNQLAATNNSTFNFCQKVVVLSTGVVLVCTKSGLQRSANGGTSFTKVLGTGLGITGAVSNFCYDAEVAANGDIYASLNQSIHKSTDGGITFGSAQTVPISMSRVELACAPGDANYVYAVVELSSAINGILRTVNGGTTWTSRTEPVDDDNGISPTDYSNGQAWYDISMAVDPNDRDILYVGGIDLFKSTDGAASWTQISHWYGGFGSQYVHADQHNVQFKSGSSSVIYFCNDGGIFQTTNGTNAIPTISDKGSNLVTAQFFGCAMHPTALTSHFLAGAQDNGSHLFTTDVLQNTVQVTGGDGAFCNIDQDQSQYQFTQYVYNNYRRSTDGGFSFVNVNNGNTGRFINPSDYDDVNNLMYAARNADQYIRWNDPQTGNSFSNVSVPAFNGGQVSALKVSPNTNNRVFFAMGNGDVFRVNSAHTNAPAVTDISTGLPSAFASCIEVETGNDNHLLVTYSNFGQNSIWESTDGGASWNSVEGNLPDMPVRWALFNPNNNDQALIATDLGVWSTDNLNGGATVWGASNSGLANVRVDQLQVRQSDKLVIASTHGRGLFSSDIFTTPTALFTADKIITYKGTNIQFTSTSYKDVSWAWDFGDGNNSTLENPVHAYTTAGIYNVTLTINAGAATITKNSYIQVLPDRGTPYILTDGGNFEVNPNDFGGDNLTASAWARGNSVQAGKNGTLSGSNAWVTGIALASYSDNEDNRLMTPNFNMTTAGLYTISFFRKNSFEIDFDGFRVEYTLDKGTTWTPLGTVQANWYDFANNASTTSFDVNEPYFNLPKTLFTLCQYDVSFLAGNANVAFRLRFKSDGGVTDAGVAIDDFQLLGPPNVALPLNLTSFEASKQNADVLLKWNTQNEINVSHFELERSTDAIHFEKIYHCPAKNEVSHQYDYTDLVSRENINHGKLYYRLKMADNDSHVSYSDIRSIDFGDQGKGFSFGPNPFSDLIRINTLAIIHAVTVYDLSGNKVYENRQIKNRDIRFNASLPAGWYVMKVETENGTYTERVLKADQ